MVDTCFEFELNVYLMRILLRMHVCNFGKCLEIDISGLPENWVISSLLYMPDITFCYKFVGKVLLFLEPSYLF
jgi:hypothetical protein